MTRVKAISIREGGFIWGYEWDCIFTTRVGDRHTPVMHGISGTVTCRPGELAVIVPKR